MTSIYYYFKRVLQVLSLLLLIYGYTKLFMVEKGALRLHDVRIIQINTI
jgi:hypothetical protein